MARIKEPPNPLLTAASINCRPFVEAAKATQGGLHRVLGNPSGYETKYMRFNGLTSVIREAKLLPKNSPGGSGGSLSQVPSKIVSQLLEDWHAGDDEALRAVVPLVYDELRRVAHHYLRKERADHTLQSTALVHEAYLRLEKQGAAKFQNRAHFLAICAQLMRQILVEYARSRNAAKRDGGDRVALDGLAFKSRTVDMVALDDALNELAKLDPQQSRIVELRFFGGLSIEETSDVLKLSPMTVKRHWATARAWLHHQISQI
jgi:RNA polymerase sigma factor (TIGR02999 family)